jgi:hypothetical protein
MSKELHPEQLRQEVVQLRKEIVQARPDQGLLRPEPAALFSKRLRKLVKFAAGVPVGNEGQESTAELLVELNYLRQHSSLLRPIFVALAAQRVLFAGQAYYNSWYLSRALRKRGWQADLLNWDCNEASQIYYHGEDIRFRMEDPYPLERDLRFYTAALYDYDLFHFSNAHGICFGFPLQVFFRREWGLHSEIRLLKQFNKKIVYGNNGCLDGVSPSSFSKWGPESVCAICPWHQRPDVCSDARNLAWGKFRNEVADYQCLLGGNRVDHNAAPTVHESPEFYCLDPALWNPELPIPDAYRLAPGPPATVRLYHAVGNKKERTSAEGVNIKSSHVYLPLVEKLQAEGIPLELIAPMGIPNKEVRFLQMQADIVLEMLTFGWFGANAREAMMLAKPVICFIRPEWLESLRREIPEYAETLPIISATPATVEAVLRDLIANPEKRREIGARSRAFALRWHGMEGAGEKFDQIYTQLLSGNALRLADYA